MSQPEGCNLLRIVCPLWIEAEACGKGEWLPFPLPGSFCTGPQIMLPTWVEQMNSMIRLAYRKDHLDCYVDCRATGEQKGRPVGRQESRGEIIVSQIRVASRKMVGNGQIKIHFEHRAKKYFLADET